MPTPYRIRKYWRNKRAAAIWILSQICIHPKVKIIRNESLHDGDIDVKSFDWFKFPDLVARQGQFHREILRDAVDMLFRNKHIDMLDNQYNRFDIQIKALEEGQYCYLERFYDLEIIKDRNALYASYGSWLFPLIALLLSVVSITIALVALLLHPSVH